MTTKNETAPPSAPHTANADEAAPVFVCGALRSGTTMLHLMLNHHPALASAGETDFLFEYPQTGRDAADAKAYREQLADDGLFASTGLSIPDGDSVAEMVRSLTRQMRVPGRRLTINIHRNFERIPEIFPDTKIVHIVRDPRDVARSSIGMGWNGNAYHGVDHWIASERSMEAMRTAYPGVPVLTVKNEDLVRSPQSVLTGICEFIGAAYDPAMLSYPENSTYDAPDPSLVEQWRRKMSERDLGLVEGRVGEMLAARGYAPSGAPIIIPDAALARRLRAEDRWGRFRETVRRYGAFLTLAELAGRRTGLQGLRRFAQKRIDVRHKLFLK